ncbi:C40 family peptidase [Neomicrococcus lactis]|uniref:Cell wall-associated NlpC family hydrolase n=1 Tax=Neomicrococcus lactis TaxID=732241 RepID=A0A7W8YBI8_9MICC|nr:C40 family peptidase [Neomicrococcus lactis]MBB5598412.1 cell wall-associated NlpC family hydrolase [Neomicrococcus lactis]
MSKRIALGGHRSGETRSNSIAGISKAVAANAGSFGRSAAVVAAASGMVLTLGVPAQANPAAREAAAAPMDALNIERVALQSSVVATVVAPTADSKKAETAQVRATLKTAPAPAKAKAEPKTVTASVKAVENANEAATTEAPAAQNTVSAAQNTVSAAQNTVSAAQNTVSAAQNTVSAAETRAAEKREAAQKRAAEKRAAEKRAAEKRAAAAKKQREAAERRASASTNAFAPVTRSNRTGAAASTSIKSVAPASSSVNTASLSGIAATASRYSGVPYVWGGASPRGWDCSGFVQWVYKQHGINLVRGTSALRSSGQFVRTGNPKPGDLVFQNGGGHVGIYLGNGMMIGAQNPTVDTMIHSVSRNPLYGYYTYVG